MAKGSSSPSRWTHCRHMDKGRSKKGSTRILPIKEQNEAYEHRNRDVYKVLSTTLPDGFCSHEVPAMRVNASDRTHDTESWLSACNYCHGHDICHAASEVRSRKQGQHLKHGAH